MAVNEKNKTSEFYWALIGGVLIPVLLLTLYSYKLSKKLPGNVATKNWYPFAGYQFLFLFVIAYIIAGLLTLFSKKTSSFGKGILLAALALFLFSYFIGSWYTG